MAVEVSGGREQQLLAEAAEESEYASLADLTPAVMARVTAQRGVDYATALLYDRLLRAPEHGPAIEQLSALRGASPQAGLLSGVTCAVAPGAFYREFPHTGADGRILRDAAEQFGCRATLIPSSSTGTLRENAQAILRWLEQNRSEPIILASVSKGGADVKAALALDGAHEIFRPVVAWVDVCGILDGSPMVNWLLARRLRTAFYRLLFRWRGYNFDVIRDLRHGAGAPLDFPLRLPRDLYALHVIGFPLTGHMTNRLSRTFRQRIASGGPNDGCVMLADVCRLPGVVYPVWGADHYMRPSWELRALARAIFAHLAARYSQKELRA